jgi:hypothetical protein
VRSSATPELRAFACIGVVAAAVLISAISAWDRKIGHFVLDRYLYYLVPILLLAFLCALHDRRRPRWSLLFPVGLVALGFAIHLQESFLWSGRFPLSTDSPIATLYRPIAWLGGGHTGASTILVIATIALAVLFVLADRRLRHARLVAVLSAVLLVAFPADTGYTFAKLFSTNGHSYRPLTRSESGILDWLDRTVGTGGRVTEIPYPVSSSFLVTQQFWRDLEFWNKSVRYGIHYPTTASTVDTSVVGSRASVSCVPGPPPRTSTEPTVPGGGSTTVTPVSQPSPVSCSWPTRIPGTSVIIPMSTIVPPAVPRNFV